MCLVPAAVLVSTRVLELRHSNANLTALAVYGNNVRSHTVRHELASVQLPLVTELSMLRSLTKLAAYIGADEEDWRRSSAHVVVSTWGNKGCQTPTLLYMRWKEGRLLNAAP